MKVFLLYSFCLYFIIFIEGVLCTNQELRIKNIDRKIAGGSEVNIKDFPYQAHLIIETDEEEYTCGGSIISNTYILTAAHCLDDATKISVRVGSQDADEGGDLIESTNFEVHPKYNSKTLDFDVGLVHLETPIEYGEAKQAISLPAKETHISSGTKLTVSGWGSTSENEDASDILMAVTVPTLSNIRCRKSYKVITRNMICAGVPEGGKDACEGDSGGPAVANKQQIGIVSFGLGCARPGYPGVYARVASPAIRKWIKEISGV